LSAGAQPEPPEGGAPAATPVTSGWRKLPADVGHLERSALAPLRSLPPVCGIVLTLAAGLAAGDPAAAVSMAAGALIVGVTSLVVGPRPVPTACAVTVAMALATFAGSATGSDRPLHLALIVPFALAAGLAGAFGQQTSTIATQAVVAMIVFGRFAEPLPGALELAAYVAAGAAGQTVVLAATTALGGMVEQRRLVAAAYDALAGLASAAARNLAPAAAPPRPARAGTARASGLEPAEALDAAARYLASPALFGLSAAKPLTALVAEGERIRVEIAALASLSGQLREVAPGSAEHGLEAELRGAAGALSEIAAALRRGRRRQLAAATFPGPEPCRDGTRPAAAGDGAGPLEVALGVAAQARLSALAGQLRAAARLAGEAIGAPPLPALPSGGAVVLGRLAAEARPARLTAALERGATRLRAQLAARARAAGDVLADNLGLGSPLFRHALRLTAVLVLCEVVADLAPLQRGYWIALTAAVVLRPDFGATLTRGTTRAIGTLCGVGLASLVVLGHPGSAGGTVLVAVLAWLSYTVFQANYALYSCALTALVVVLLGFVTTDSLGTAADRLLDTLIGAAIALVAYILWPTWSAGDALERLARLVAAQRAYAGLVLGALAGTAPLEDAAFEEPSRRARRERAASEEAVGRALADPAAHRIDPAMSSALLGALRRFVFAVHAVRADLRSGELASPMPALAPFAAAVDEAMGAIATAVGRPAGQGQRVELPPLRRLYDEMVERLGDQRRGLAVLAAADEMVDALDSAAAALGRAPVASSAAPRPG
jgi:hypothetical protein